MKLRRRGKIEKILHAIRCNRLTCGPCHGNKMDYHPWGFCKVFDVSLECGRKARNGVRSYKRHACCLRAAAAVGKEKP